MKLRELFSCVSGNVTMMAAVALPVVVGVAGVAITMTDINYETVEIQSALDAGVLAGTAISISASDQERIAEAHRAFAANAKNGKFVTADRAGEFEAGGTVKPVFTVSEARVSGIAVSKSKDTFLSTIGLGSVDISVEAQAERQESDPVCVLALNEDSPDGLEVYGNAQFNARNCAVQANSDHSEGMTQTGRSSATASQFGVTGNFDGENFFPPPFAGIERVKDPYEDLPVPTPGACVDVAAKLIQAVVTLDPGTYCGGLNIKAGSQVTLNPGVYVMKDGQFAVNSGATVRGEEVMIAFVGADSYIHLLSDAHVTVTSPRDGTYKNMQFMSDRDLSSSKHGEEWTTILGGASLEYDGVMYLPEQQVWVSGSAHDTIVRGSSPTMIMVADKIWSQGNAIFELTQEDKRGIGFEGAQARFYYGARLVR
jgi:hypothetical protein